jgi:dTDP-4-dehydrorhamnose 3,5-epimerase
MNPLSKEDIDEKYSGKISTQDYSKKPVIDGVKIVELKNIVGEDGNFSELMRLSENGESQEFLGFFVKQISSSHILGGAIKAWHIHLNQEDVWHIQPHNKMIVGLLDARKNSPTKDTTMRLSLGGGKAHLLYIPRGVAHGAVNISKKPGTIIYFVNQQFNIENPDEHRLPWNILGEDFWKPIIG